MINNVTLLLFILIVLIIIQLFMTIASFVLLIKLIKIHSVDSTIKYNKNLMQNESDIQSGMQQENDEEINEYVFTEDITLESLDSFDELEHTESDPDKLLKILEFGLPDEELEEIMKKLSKD